MRFNNEKDLYTLYTTFANVSNNCKLCVLRSNIPRSKKYQIIDILNINIKNINRYEI